jgi:hypothetical protein
LERDLAQPNVAEHRDPGRGARRERVVEQDRAVEHIARLEVVLICEEDLAEQQPIEVVLRGELGVHREPPGRHAEEQGVLLVQHEAHAVAAERRGDDREAARRLPVDDHERDLVVRLGDAQVDVLAAVAVGEPAPELVLQQDALALGRRADERAALACEVVDEATRLLGLDAGVRGREDVGVLEVEPKRLGTMRAARNNEASEAGTSSAVGGRTDDMRRAPGPAAPNRMGSSGGGWAGVGAI